MTSTKYGKYVSKEIVRESKYPQITAPMVKYQGDRGGRDLTFEWYCVTNPVVMDDEPEVNDFDQFLFFAGSNFNDLSEFEAEVELPLGKERKTQIITEPKFVHIPKGLIHGPVKFKNVKKPVVYYSINVAPKYSTESNEAWAYEKYLVNPAPMKGRFLCKATHLNDVTPFRHQSMWMYSLNAFSKPLGLYGNLCWGYTVYRCPCFITLEPWHYHKKLDEWIIYMGSNPLNVEEFDAEIEMFWGEEREKQVINSTCVCHIPPGLIHYGNDHRRVGKPFYEIITVPVNFYFEEKDKIVLSREEDGDVMISEGAPDYGMIVH
jgi:hypothetical protein